MVLKECVSDENGLCPRCIEHGNKLMKLRGGVFCCKVYAGWKPTAKPCFGCGGLVPAHEIWVVNPEIDLARQAGKLERPYLGREFRRVFPGDLPNDSHVICAECAGQAMLGINPQQEYRGRFKIKDSDQGLTAFLSPAMQREAAQQAAERRAAEEAAAQQAEEAQRRAAQPPRLTSPMAVFKAIVKGTRLKRSDHNRRTQARECVVHANAEAACVCGGWHQMSDLRAYVASGFVFGFGPTCAEAVLRHRPKAKFTQNFQEELEKALGHAIEGGPPSEPQPVNQTASVEDEAGVNTVPLQPRKAKPTPRDQIQLPSPKLSAELDAEMAGPTNPHRRSDLLGPGKRERQPPTPRRRNKGGRRKNDNSSPEEAVAK